MAAPPPRGFTLLEIMVVLVLVGILASFALLSAGGGPRERLAEEARRLTALVELHQQEAIYRGETRGVRFSQTGYALLSLGDQGEWRPPAASDALTSRALPDDLTVKLWIEGQAIDLKNPGESPQVWLLPSGEATEFTAVFGPSDDPAPSAPFHKVTGDNLGRLTLGEATR